MVYLHVSRYLMHIVSVAHMFVVKLYVERLTGLTILSESYAFIHKNIKH